MATAARGKGTSEGEERAERRKKTKGGEKKHAVVMPRARRCDSSQTLHTRATSSHDRALEPGAEKGRFCEVRGARAKTLLSSPWRRRRKKKKKRLKIATSRLFLSLVSRFRVARPVPFDVTFSSLSTRAGARDQAPGRGTEDEAKEVEEGQEAATRMKTRKERERRPRASFSRCLRASSRLSLAFFRFFRFFPLSTLPRSPLRDTLHVPAWPMWREMTSRMVLEWWWKG